MSQYTEKDRYRKERSFMSSTSNLVIKSIEQIEKGLSKGDWNETTQGFLSTVDNLHELNAAAEIEMDYFIIEPTKKDIPDIPLQLAAFLPKEKTDMDTSLHNTFLKENGISKDINEEEYENIEAVIRARNDWCDYLLKEINNYNASIPKRKKK